MSMKNKRPFSKEIILLENVEKVTNEIVGNFNRMSCIISNGQEQ
jgi:hypothetical protein